MTFHSVRAPFDALVGEVLVGRGQNVGPQFPLMTLTDVSSFRVRARVPTAELARLPQLTAKEDAPERRAHVVQRLGALEQRVGASVRGRDGSVDPTSRTASLVVDVPDPLGLSAEPPPPQALLLGGLVDVELETSALEGVAELPERAVYEGAHVYLCDEADTLRKRAVSLVGRTPGAVLVGAGLADGMRVVRTRLIAPVEGTRLQCGGFASMPFALRVLAGRGEAEHAPVWIGYAAAGGAFLLAGAGAHIVQTAGLALATDLTPPRSHARVVGLMYVTLLLGMIASALIFGVVLSDYEPGKLIQLIQGVAVTCALLNCIAVCKQEARDHRRRPGVGAPDPTFREAWAHFTTGSNAVRRLAIIGLGTMAFAMSEVLLEPYGGQVLNWTVASTTHVRHAASLLA